MSGRHTQITSGPGDLHDDLDVRYKGLTGKWTVRASGFGCDGLETWEIDDATAAIEYLGLSKVP